VLNGLQPWHILVLVAVLVVLFGAKRLPDAARGIGKSMRIFKAEASKMRDEDGDEHSNSSTTTATTTAPQQLTQQPTQPAPPIEQTQARNEQQQL
jgi:sec-independent protein translocase protein TatA